MSIRGMKRRTFIAALGGAAAWSASGARTAAGDAGDRFLHLSSPVTQARFGEDV
jgi:hypothetical protein